MTWLKDDYDDYLIYDLPVSHAVKSFADNSGTVPELSLIRVTPLTLTYIYFLTFLCVGEGDGNHSDHHFQHFKSGHLLAPAILHIPLPHSATLFCGS